MRKAVSAAIIRNGRILLVRKKASWILPGGKPESGESNLECLTREIAEEIGVTPNNVQFYKNIEGITPHRGDRIRVAVYFAEVEGEITPNAEIGAAEWIEDVGSCSLSHATHEIIASLRRDGYL